MIALALTLAAAAAVVTIDDDGAVTGVLETPVSVEVLRAKLGDPTWLPSVSRDGTRVSVVRRDGDCLILDSESPSVITVRYRTRQCPTPTGYSFALVSSDSFTSYAASWTLTPTASGTRATYRLVVVSTLWVPQAVVRRSTRAGIEQMMTNLEQWRPPG